MTVKPLLTKSARDDAPARVALFLSGHGSNAEKILELQRARENPAFEVVALVTDAPPERSRARLLAERFAVPVVENDIRAFYRDHGLTRVTLRSEEGRAVREAWTDAVRKQLAQFAPDFGVLAGFVPLTNLVGDFPCLNVHPGDLTYIKNGARHLIGLHTLPVERAILEGLDCLRSSVILAEPYAGDGGNMDSGPLLGLSPSVPVDLQGHSREALADCLCKRPEKRPKGGFGDDLERVADHNLTRLKERGDWIVLPSVVADFADGRFGLDSEGGLQYRGRNHKWFPIRTVEYLPDGKELIFRSGL
ncbi:MAG: formyltransferase family protein [Verrucomicrobiota bacterium]